MGAERSVSNGTSNGREPFIRRTGEALAIIAIVALTVAVIDARITSNQNATVIEALEKQAQSNAKLIATQMELNTTRGETQDKIIAVQLAALAENIKLQLGMLKSLFERVTAGGFNAAEGAALTERMNRLDSSMFDLQLTVIESLIELLEPKNTALRRALGEIHTRQEGEQP
jgi:hypothetical protein